MSRVLHPRNVGPLARPLKNMFLIFIKALIYNLIIEQTALVNLDGLQGLQAVYGSVSIHDNGFLLSLGGLQNLEVVGGNLLIHNHLVLNHLGLSGLRRVNGNFQITNNHMLLNVQALALKHQVIEADGIGGAVIISGNLL